jgi:hypothetical protein
MTCAARRGVIAVMAIVVRSGSGRKETAMEPLILLGGLLAGAILVWLVLQPGGS